MIKIVVSVSNEKSSTLLTCFLGNKWENIGKRTFPNPFLKHQHEQKTKTGDDLDIWVLNHFSEVNTLS